MNPIVNPSPRRQRLQTRPADSPRPVPPEERAQALSADLIQAFALIARRRF